MEFTEQKKDVNVWKANLKNGLIMAAIGIGYTIIINLFNLTFTKAQTYILYLIQIVVLFFMLKGYRDKYKGGYITYGESVGAGAVIFLICAAIMAAFMYVLYKFIDPSLLDESLAYAEEMLVERGVPQETIDTAMEMQESMMTPGFIAISGIFTYFLYGLVFSLVDSIFVKNTKNPVLE